METETERSRTMLVGKDILDFAEGGVTDVFGTNPRARFILDRGHVIDVSHEGDHLVVRVTEGGGLSIDAQAGNTVLVRVTRD